MSLNQQIDALIALARAQSIGVDDVVDEIRIRWEPQGAAILKIDEFGRHSIAGSKHLFLSPLPILLGMELTPLQLANIKPNCGVDDAGNEQPAAFIGFTDETGGNQQVAYLAARKYSLNMKPGDQPPVFQPRTFRSRFRTIDEAVQYVAANPWVQ
jgi:hypothetical protein